MASSITTNSKALGGFIVSKTKAGASAINGKIESNEKLYSAKESTKKGFGMFSSSVKSSWGALTGKLYPKKEEIREVAIDYKE